MRSLVIVEHDNAGIKPATLNTVGAATQMGAAVDLLVAGCGCAKVAQLATKIAGVSKVLLADAIHYVDQSPENVAALVLAHTAGYSHIFAPATTAGKNVLPRVAALLDVAQISDIVAIVTADTFVRPIYAGNILSTVQSSDKVKVITVRATAFEPAAEGGDARIEIIVASADQGRSRVLSRDLTASGRPELAAARVIVAGGRGLASSENFQRLLEPLADKLGAALGATRAAVDAGFVANDSQIGQTGKVVAPQLYIAVGLSGAIQHVAGMKDSRVIVAINKDPDAPIFQVADIALVADLFEAVPALTAEL